jgi:hypothetical protein
VRRRAAFLHKLAAFGRSRAVLCLNTADFINVLYLHRMFAIIQPAPAPGTSYVCFVFARNRAKTDDEGG